MGVLEQEEFCTISWIFPGVSSRPKKFSPRIQTTMCRQIRCYHLSCQHWHRFYTIECDTFKEKKEKRPQKRGFWRQLLGSKVTCKTILLSESKYNWCPFCTRAQNLVYPSDEFGMDLDAAGSEGRLTGKDEREELVLKGGPSRQDLIMPDLPPNLLNSVLKISSSHQPRRKLPEIRSNMVDPGIDFERWIHARDHIIPPRPGPPPDKPLPPTPVRRQPIDTHKQLASASQGRERGKTGQGIHANLWLGSRARVILDIIDDKSMVPREPFRRSLGNKLGAENLLCH